MSESEEEFHYEEDALSEAEEEFHYEDAPPHPNWERILSPRGQQRFAQGAALRDASCGALLIARTDLDFGKGRRARQGDTLICRQAYEPYWGRERSHINDPNFEKWLRKHWYR